MPPTTGETLIGPLGCSMRSYQGGEALCAVSHRTPSDCAIPPACEDTRLNGMFCLNSSRRQWVQRRTGQTFLGAN